MHWVPQLLTAVGEGNLKPGIISKTDGGAIGQDALVVSIIRPPAQLEHEVASSQICDERFQLPGMSAAAVEISSEPWAHSGFAVIARLRNHDMKDAGVYSGVEIAVSDGLQFLKAPVVLGEYHVRHPFSERRLSGTSHLPPIKTLLSSYFCGVFRDEALVSAKTFLSELYYVFVCSIGIYFNSM